MKPLLSIGIIFKNEIRCLERCLRSLEGLRQAVPCQLVMADTGSDDGSREVAAKYADILFDFPWVDDFSAARNAVMDRCSGEWYLSVDADEWLDADYEELVRFLRTNNERAGHICGVIVRNYTSEKLDWQHSDFMAVRMVRMSTGLRYEGRVHEVWDPEGHYKLINPLQHTILHHDGYVVLNNGSEEGERKFRRNKVLLDAALKERPNDLKLLLQRIEGCGSGTAEQIPYLHRAIKLIRELKDPEEQPCAPVVLSQAVHTAREQNLPEIWEWAALADELYPNTIYTTVDIQFYATERAWIDMDCRRVIEHGERYLRGVRDYREGNFNIVDLLQSPISCTKRYQETGLRAYIARACLYEGQPEKALELLRDLNYETIDQAQAESLTETMIRLQSLSEVDTAPLIREFWENITAAVPSEEEAEKRRTGAVGLAGNWFSADWIADETAMMERHMPGMSQTRFVRAAEWNVVSRLELKRHGYTLFKPLLGQAMLGAAAAILDEEDPDEIAGILHGEEDVSELPIHVLAHALRAGVCFPSPDRLWNTEEFDALAVRLSRNWKDLSDALKMAAADDFTGSWQALLWARSLALASVQAFDWKDEEQGMELARTFVRVERAFLPGYYAPEILREGNLYALPALHRFGWYCVQAFDSLEAGDPVSCVRYLREGLAFCEGAKNMVEFLLENMPELQGPPPNPELLELAEKIKALLAMYPADDPAVTALKASPAYQKVAHLIET